MKAATYTTSYKRRRKSSDLCQSKMDTCEDEYLEYHQLPHLRAIGIKQSLRAKYRSVMSSRIFNVIPRAPSFLKRKTVQIRDDNDGILGNTVQELIATTVVVTVSVPTQTINLSPSSLSLGTAPVTSVESSSSPTPSTTPSSPGLSSTSVGLASVPSSFTTTTSPPPTATYPSSSSQVATSTIPTTNSPNSRTEPNESTVTSTTSATRINPSGTLTISGTSSVTTLNSIVIVTTSTSPSSSPINVSSNLTSQSASTTSGSNTSSITSTSAPSASTEAISTSSLFSPSSFTYSTSSTPTSIPASTTTSSQPSATTTAAVGGSGTGGSSNLPPILGGVLGGICGIGLILWAILFLLRRRKVQYKSRTVPGAQDRGIVDSSTTSGGRDAEVGIPPEGPPVSQARSSMMPFAAGGFFGRPPSSTPPSSERGFVKVSGRKMPSILGNEMTPPMAAGAGPAGTRDISGSTTSGVGSYYVDDEGNVHSHTPIPVPGRHSRTSSPGMRSTFIEGEPETDMIDVPASGIIGNLDPGEGSTRFSTPPPPAAAVAIRRMQSGADGVGRSLPSQDGSKTSRFKEDV